MNIQRDDFDFFFSFSFFFPKYYLGTCGLSIFLNFGSD